MRALVAFFVPLILCAQVGQVPAGIFGKPAGGGGSIAFVNSVKGDNGATTSPTVDTDAKSLTAGNTMICGIRIGSTSQTVTGITDTASNTYVQVPGAKSSLSAGTDIWEAKNVTGNASNTVRVTTSNTNQYQAAICIQFSGLSITAPVDTSANGGTASSVNTVTSGNFTPAAGGELIVWEAIQNVGGGAWSGGGANTINSGPSEFLMAYNTSGSAGAQTASLTYSVAGPMDISVGAFKP